ncbi:MAG: V-type ATP synthase subunit D [Lentisphaerales bacterium]|jgi:V/A-type H+-transporting ATPase subunit D|nr:MAG: V-type ATP synthase subunit D [Lentisphaerales bacterium]
MAKKIKHTKNELKAQREALARFQRFLPMLQLKQQQLQAEMQSIDHRRNAVLSDERALLDNVKTWSVLFSEPLDIEGLLAIKELRVGEANVAGVGIPVFEEMTFARSEVDLFTTPPWLDAGLDAVEQLGKLRVQRKILDEQFRKIGYELRITTQRVNLFEKVKIPECKEHIRVIRIFLGDEQTAAVARAKLAKSRTVDYAYKDEAA